MTTPTRDLKSDLEALKIDREPGQPGRRFGAGWIASALVVAALAGGAWVWAARAQVPEVQVVAVTERPRGAQTAVLDASGYVTARRRATISSKVTGKVTEVNVEEGVAVKEGQILARLDDANAKASLAVAEEQVEAAKRAITENDVRLADAWRTLNRRSQLLEEEIGTQADVDLAQADVDSLAARIAAANEGVRLAESEVAVQQTDLDNTVIRAPFSGVVISKDAQPGEMVSPVSAGGGFTRTGICTIVDMTSLEIDVDVNEAFINRVVAGQEVSAALNAYPDWSIPSRVITTIPTADRQKATVLVRIAFDQLDPRILPDMGVKVSFLPENGRAASLANPASVLVPKAALRADGNENVVFVAKSNGTVERRAVRIGGEDGADIEVLAGLTRGEQVVAAPSPTLKDGARVRVTS